MAIIQSGSPVCQHCGGHKQVKYEFWRTVMADPILGLRSRACIGSEVAECPMCIA